MTGSKEVRGIGGRKWVGEYEKGRRSGEREDKK